MPPAVHLLAKEQFLAVYLSSGFITSLASMVHKVAVGSTAYSLGGVICCVLQAIKIGSCVGCGGLCEGVGRSGGGGRGSSSRTLVVSERSLGIF